MAYQNIDDAKLEAIMSYLGLSYQDKGDHYLAPSPFRADRHPDLWIYRSGYCVDYAGIFRGSIFKLFYELTGQLVSRAMPDLGLGDVKNGAWLPFVKRVPVAGKIDKRHELVITEERIIKATQDIDAYRYCLSRGIDERMIEDWNIAYCRRARIRNVDAPEPGTLISRRLLIPIVDGGETWSVECRDITRQDPKKVLYPRGCSVDTLFGIDRLDRKKSLVVVEGLMDLVKTIRAHPNSTCTFGIQVAARQRRLLNEFDRIILLPDSDEGGERFIESMGDLYEKELWVARVPEKDPGDSTAEQIGKSIDEARPLVELQVDSSRLFMEEKLLW